MNIDMRFHTPSFTQLVFGAALFPLLLSAAEPESGSIEFFEKKIRPVLVDRCYSCHSAEAEKLKAGLHVDSRAGLLKGGDSGPAIVPGDPEKSLLITAIRWSDDDMAMPPKEKLPQEVIADFEKWVREGAADSREGKVPAVAKKPWDAEAAKSWWAFQPIKKPAPPPVKNEAWPRGDIDRFVLAKMQEHALTPAAAAAPGVLLRRVFFDLIGLPPSPEQAREMTNGAPHQTYEQVVDMLLQSPQFGEKWGRHWLDVARYAESGGRERNSSFPHAWRYRDYVIRAFNNDLPYDQFITEQIAGDLIGGKDDTEKAWREIATGYLAIGTKPVNIRDANQFRLDVADEQLDTVSQSMLGLTLACARCHDHKFDPFTQRDYYALAGIFASSDPLYGGLITIGVNQTADLLALLPHADVPAAGRKLSHEELTALQTQLAEAKASQVEVQASAAEGMKRRDPVSYARNAAARGKVQDLQRKLDAHLEDGTPRKLAMAVVETRYPKDLPIYARGELDKPGDLARRGFPAVLAQQQPRMDGRESGRLELARWMASPDNPLTARVMVNRVWQQLMGQGIVATPDNFGTTGSQPTHPELLDYLAASFIENGWSVKQLIKSIVLSRTYQMSSAHHVEHFAIDPDNAFLWHHSPRRLSAEELRDAMLSASGQILLQAPVGSPVHELGEGFVAATFTELKVRGGAPGGGVTTALPGFKIEDFRHRSVYLPVLRDLVVEPLALFDFAEASMVTGRRADTSVPAQALYLMNSPLVMKQAEAMAAGLRADASLSTEQRLAQAFQLAYARNATANEITNARQFIANFKSASTQDAWTAFCQSLIASAEFRHLD